MLLDAQTYMGKLVGYGVTASKGGEARPTLKFLIEGQPVYWAGTFKDKGIDICLKTLVTCGLKNTEDLQKITEGPLSGVLDLSKDYELVVIQKEVTDEKTGNTSWVNEVKFVNGGQSQFAMKPADFARVIVERNLKGTLAQILSDQGIKSSSTSNEEQPKIPVPF